MIKLVIPGKPIGKKTLRFAGKKRANSHAFNPNETEEGRFLLELYRQIGDNHELIKGPVLTRYRFYIGRPKSHYGTGRNAKQLKASAPAIPTVTPDMSNCEKFYEDCFNGVVWVDDRQVFDSHKIRLYDDNPRVEIVIKEV